MPVLLVILFVAVPLVELLVILRVGAVIGAGWTIGLLVADSVLGAWLLRVEGSRAWTQFRAALLDGRWPGDEVAQGALVIVGGTLLLTPGFVTDVVGFLLLVAPTRRLLSGWLRRRVAAGASWTVGGHPHRSARGRPPEQPRRPQLEVEVVEIQRDAPDTPAVDGTGDGPDEPATDDDADGGADPRVP
jgi:UPF0716 protein FxsA